MVQSAKQRDAEVSGVREEIAAVREAMAALQGTVKTQKDKVARAEVEAQTPPKKRVVEAVKDDAGLSLKINALQRLLEREQAEHELAEAELAHVKGEIRRAHEMIDTFKENLTKEKQDNADDVNSRLKQFIEQQRDDYRRAIANQKKRNIELEKQKTELTEEERMLTGVLQGLDKQLQAQMQRLPSLAQMQQRGIGTSVQKRTTPGKAMRPLDDAEMRGIKKAILLLKTRKGVSRSVLVGSRFH
jgi:chromosome segregation ATPase